MEGLLVFLGAFPARKTTSFMPSVFYIYDLRNPVKIDFVDQPKLACIVLANGMYFYCRNICANDYDEIDDVMIFERPLLGAINNLDVNTDLCVHPDASRARIAEISFMKRMVEQSFQTYGASWA
jgi:hypothetical protein